MATPEQKSRSARIAGNISWARTPNRTERTAPARRKSPVSRDYWIAHVRAEGVVPEKDIVKAAENYHRAYMTQLSSRAAAARAAKKTATAAADTKRSLRRSA
ncbi:hypothetical protein [Streptosporangium sp. NPDC051022]|uniref:hypothetical protein n=1 Tax=Streptosporangium sp. NPDC051022 TaxID=3155752 RepID=UPI0034168841